LVSRGVTNERYTHTHTHYLSLRNSLLHPLAQVTAGNEVLYTSKAALQQGCCTWDKEIMMRDVATSGQLSLEVWAVDTSE
jgi:hypothetical protein